MIEIANGYKYTQASLQVFLLLMKDLNRDNCHYSVELLHCFCHTSASFFFCCSTAREELHE
jgi:hypothetical protein